MEKTNIFITCGPGLEKILMKELKQLGLKDLKEGRRGIYAEGATLNDCYLVNYCSRVATRVLWQLKRFKCPTKDILYNEVKAIPWEKYIDKKATIAIDANVSANPNIRHSQYAAQVVKDAVCDRLRDLRGERPNVDIDNPSVQLNLYISGTGASLTLDTSGKPLHKRGYRQDGGEAPLQENLAAAILMLMGYDGSGVLCDPLCGSGTFLIEAALIASATPPGYLRTEWGFMRHPDFKQEEWLRIKNAADKNRKPLKSGVVRGMDLDPKVLTACKKNLRASGFGESVMVTQEDFMQGASFNTVQWVVANPPYDKRIALGAKQHHLYSKLAEIAQTGKADEYAFLFPESFDVNVLKLFNSKTVRLSNGGIPIQVLLKKNGSSSR